MVLRSCLLVAVASCGDAKPTPPNPVPPENGATTGIAGDSTGGPGGTTSATPTSGSGGAGTSMAGGATSTGNAGGEGGEAGAADGASSADAGSTSSTATGGGAGGGPATPGCGSVAEGGTPEICSIEIACALSSAIPTVGVIDWSTDLAGLSEARIEFTLADPAADELNTGSGGPIDIAGTTHRALMLGLKPERTYTYRIVASGAGQVCTSPDHTLTTGTSADAPTVSRTVHDASARARGFIVTSGGYPFRVAGPQMAYIIDADGEVVWWAPSQAQCSRALMDWEGANMWMVDSAPCPRCVGETRRIAMDGTGLLTDVEGLSAAHHDITVVPGGILAALVWSGEPNAASDLVERLPDGMLKTVVRLDENVFPWSSGSELHANAIAYHAADDTYTVSDRSAGAYVKLTRQGELLWQFGGDCSAARAPKCASASIGGNHGHHLLGNGNMLVFMASFGGSSPTREYSLTEQGDSLTAALVWSYEVEYLASDVLGDVQRLPNGNTLVVFSTAGEIHEVSPSGHLVQAITSNSPYRPGYVGSFGYANFRETLYGPPLR
jgi:hypothetical protein